ncbi:MAG: GNAT family N-acetyltransferase [Rikenellaceae bacterium]
MITRINIPSSEAEHFDACWELYESAFPPEERREKVYHIETMARKEFHFDAIMDNDKLVGVIGWWNFEHIIYVEHLATLPSMRNCGYGRKILSALKQDRNDKTILLEVEHPTYPIAQRRIGFYEREGFMLNWHTYIHPPYRGTDWVSLLIMTYPNAISNSELETFKSECFPVIHFRHHY